MAIIWPGEDPASVVFGLDHKYAEARDQDMINLRGSVLHAERHMVQQVIVRRHEPALQRAGNACLTLILKDMRAMSAKSKADNQYHEYNDNRGLFQCGGLAL